MITPCQKYFQDEGLKLPFIPPDEMPKIAEVADSNAVIGTRQIPQSLYDIEAFAKEFLSKPTGDYVLIGRGGAGIDKPIHYYVVKGHLALFVQLKAGSADYVDGHLKAIEYIFKRMAEVEQKHPLPANKRLLVVHSDIRDIGGWGWITDHPGTPDEKTWHRKEPMKSPLLNALAELTQMKK